MTRVGWKDKRTSLTKWKWPRHLRLTDGRWAWWRRDVSRPSRRLANLGWVIECQPGAGGIHPHKASCLERERERRTLSSLWEALSKNAYRARLIILQVYLTWRLSHHLQLGIMRSNWPSAGAIVRSWSAATLASSCSERPHATIGHTGTIWHNHSQNHHPQKQQIPETLG